VSTIFLQSEEADYLSEKGLLRGQRIYQRRFLYVSEDAGRLLENAVFAGLKQRGLSAITGKGKKNAISS